MRRVHRWILVVCLLLGQFVPGCGWRQNQPHKFHGGDDMAHYRHVVLGIEYPDVGSTIPDAAVCTLSPLDIRQDQAPEYWDLHLDEVMQLALANATVMRDLTGVVLRSASLARTIQSPAITETDPRFGTDAALSAFDALFQYSATWEKNDRALNNTFFGGGTRILQQDLGVYQTQLSKRTAMGTRFAARHYVDYDANNAPGNQFPHAWNANIEAEFRQPLLQGGGLNFNRIVGPNGIPGQFSGVMLARVNTDISLTEFEMGVRDLTSNVENAYWDLYLAYRYLDAATKDRDLALEYWKGVEANYRAEREGFDAAMEAAARERYFQAEEDVQNAWSGRLLEGTRVNNGSSGGTLRSTSTIRGSDGIRVAERRLRLLMGLPISDGRLIRTANEPPMTKVLFDWSDVVCEGLNRRPELRRQKWMVKRRELELVGAKNFLLPQFDALGRYRWRGFGRNLLDPERNGIPFDNAYQTLTGGDFQEWQLGFEFSYSLGNRRGHVTVRNAEIQLARERTVLHEQEREVIHDLSNQVAESARAYDVAQLAYNRLMAAQVRSKEEETNLDTGVEKQPEKLLEARRQANEIEARFYIALIEYALAVKNVHYEKGSLLDYNEITLAEGGWPMKAYRDANERERRRLIPEKLNYILSPKQVVTRGPVPQQTMMSPEYVPPPIAEPPSGPAPDKVPENKEGDKAKPPAPDEDKEASRSLPNERNAFIRIGEPGVRLRALETAADAATPEPLPDWPMPEELPAVDEVETFSPPGLQE